MRRGAWLLVAGLLLTSPARAITDPSERLPDPAQEHRAERIGQSLRCLVCQNESIEDSGADLARDLRRLVRERVRAGDGDRQITAWMVRRYGDFVRLQPRFSPLTTLLWTTPGLGLLAGLAIAWRMFRGAVSRGPVALDNAERARLTELDGSPT